MARKTEQFPTTDIHATAAELADLAGAVMQLSESLKKDGYVGILEIDGIGMPRSGLDTLIGWLSKCEKAYRKKKAEMRFAGDLNGKTAGKKPKK